VPVPVARDAPHLHDMGTGHGPSSSLLVVGASAWARPGSSSMQWAVGVGAGDLGLGANLAKPTNYGTRRTASMTNGQASARFSALGGLKPQADDEHEHHSFGLRASPRECSRVLTAQSSLVSKH
jgi:hypothetical protein